MPKAAAVTPKTHNRTKVLLCYILCWGIALLLPYLGLKTLYPYKLAGTAPTLPTQITALLPVAAGETAVLPSGADPAALQSALTVRDQQWRMVVGAAVAAAWLASLVWQLLWRARYVHPRQAARAALRARRSYHASMLGIGAVNLLAATALYLAGISRIADRGLWDYLLYFGGFLLVPAAAALCSRLAAPPAISGRHAYFRRL